MPQYFSGANCFVKVGAQPILEVAGVSYQEIDSQTPIYGYSSRFFDAVAPGQKLIKGNLVVNFVRPNYLAMAIAKGKERVQENAQVAQNIANSSYGLNDEQKKLRLKFTKIAKERFQETNPGQNWDELDTDKAMGLVYQVALENLNSLNFPEAASAITELSKFFEDENLSGGSGRDDIMSGLLSPTKDVTAQVAINIDIVINNIYVIRLLDCFITSRGSVIQIDESTLVEEYSFFARNLKTLTINR